MNDTSLEPEHPKKRRRRYYPHEGLLSARLLVDDQLPEGLCVVSLDLWTKLGVRDIDDYGLLAAVRSTLKTLLTADMT